MLLLLVTAITKGWLVPGPVYQDVIKQRDRALDLVYKLAETVKAVAEKPPTSGGA
jgi:hypothetical protein